MVPLMQLVQFLILCCFLLVCPSLLMLLLPAVRFSSVCVIMYVHYYYFIVVTLLTLACRLFTLWLQLFVFVWLSPFLHLLGDFTSLPLQLSSLPSWMTALCSLYPKRVTFNQNMPVYLIIILMINKYPKIEWSQDKPQTHGTFLKYSHLLLLLAFIS